MTLSLPFPNGEKAIFMGGTVAQWNSHFLPNRLLVGSGKYCSWEPGHSRQVGALAVVTVAKLLRNSDASSMERKEGDLEGGDGIYRECQEVSRSVGFVWRMDVRFRSLLR